MTLPPLERGMRMVRCFDCCNLIKSWKPTTKRDWLFEETWRCKVTGERVEQYYFKQKERDCKHYEKRPNLVWTKSSEQTKTKDF